MDINNPEDRKKFNNFVQDAVDSLTREQSEREHRKAIADDVQETLDLDKATFNRAVRAIFNDDVEKKEAQADEMKELYDVYNNRNNG